MKSPAKRWHGFKKWYWTGRENQCEVCGSVYNYRRGRPIPRIHMDMAHLVARTELVQFGSIGNAFNYDSENFVPLCQKCHAAFDCWLGVMGMRHARIILPRFEEYRDRFWVLLQRRHRLIQALISMTTEDCNGLVG